MQKVAEGSAPDDVLEHRISDFVNFDLVQPENRLAVATGHALEKLRAG